MRIWDIRTGELLEKLQGHKGWVPSVAFTPDARGLMSGSLDKRLKCWDVSRLAGGQGGQQASPGASKRDHLNGKDKVGNGSACTMNLTGHEVNLEIEQTDPKKHLIDRHRMG